MSLPKVLSSLLVCLPLPWSVEKRKKRLKKKIHLTAQSETHWKKIVLKTWRIWSQIIYSPWGEVPASTSTRSKAMSEIISKLKSSCVLWGRGKRKRGKNQEEHNARIFQISLSTKPDDSPTCRRWIKKLSGLSRNHFNCSHHGLLSGLRRIQSNWGKTS